MDLNCKRREKKEELTMKMRMQMQIKLYKSYNIKIQYIVLDQTIKTIMIQPYQRWHLSDQYAIN